MSNTNLLVHQVEIASDTELEAFKSFELVIEAYACDEYGDGPAFAVIEVTREWTANMMRLAKVGELNQLEKVLSREGPSWDQEDDLRLYGDSLHVYPDRFFYFDAMPKYVDYHVETRGFNFDDVMEAVKIGSGNVNDCLKWHEGRLFYAGDPDILGDLIEKYSDSSDQEEGAADMLHAINNATAPAVCATH